MAATALASAAVVGPASARPSRKRLDMVWAGVVLALYPACRWFATVKARRRDPWLSYL